MKTYDALILGGGCSGLSLAMAAANSSQLRANIAILEPRTAYHDDRTWCFWDVHPHPHEDLARSRWKRWQVSNSSATTIGSGAYAYCQIRSSDFYEKALRTLGGHGTCALFKGITCLSLQPTQKGWEVATNEGVFSAPLVFDGRPPERTVETASGICQHFLGWRVEFENACFDPGVAILMDFIPTRHEGIHFVYVLPDTPRSALVESTFIGPAAFDRQTYEAILETYLNRVGHGARYRIISREAGIIPMNPNSLPTGQHHGLVEIGTRANCVKPSSGYGFLSIQRHTQAIIAKWEGGAPMISPAARPEWIRILDGIFLDWLRQHPKKAPAMFYNLFHRVPPDSLVRFLSEQPTFRDVMNVMWAMPRGEFLATALVGNFSTINR